MLLALDTSSPTVSVALHSGADDGAAAVLAQATSAQSMKHGEQVAPLIEQVLQQVGATPGDVAAIVVGAGPGPFTGLRVGLVTARTLGHVLDVPVHGVCSLDALALEAVELGLVDGDFAVATDARRKEIYLARYDAAGARTGEPVVERPAALAEQLGHLPVLGEGTRLYPDVLPGSVDDDRAPLRPAAAWLARGVVEQRVVVLEPEPLYLRRPDAEGR